MPRKSAESLTIAPMGVRAVYPSAPPGLSSRATEIWDAIAKSRRSDYFDAPGRALLAMLVRHLEMNETISVQITAALGAGGGDARMKLLLQMRAVESAAASGLATRLRLTHSATLSQTNARAAARDGASAAAEKPWRGKAKEQDDAA